MKTLYIVGNGFDIAHGLKTRYSDFYNYLSDNKDTQNFLYKMIDAYGSYDDKWWNDFEHSLGEGSWFEIEFENMAESVIEDMITDDGDEMPDIESTLSTHWESYYKFMEKLNSYVLNWISNSIDITEVEPKVVRIIDSEDYFLNFNYTMVLEEVYRISGCNVLHIHGSVTERNTIMGHGNLKAISEYKERSENAMARLDKNTATVNDAIASFYEATLKDTTSIIDMNNNFFNKLYEVETIKLYGHSLGKVDIPYLHKIKSSVSATTEWYIYSYDITEDEVRKRLNILNIQTEYIHVVPYEMFFE